MGLVFLGGAILGGEGGERGGGRVMKNANKSGKCRKVAGKSNKSWITRKVMEDPKSHGNPKKSWEFRESHGTSKKLPTHTNHGARFYYWGRGGGGILLGF